MAYRLGMQAALAIALLALSSGHGRAATIATATAAYDRHDLETAFREYQSLARLGNGFAQYNAGVMLLNGEGTRRDVRAGYAWLLCAQDHGIAEAGPLVAQIGAQVSAAVTEKARECLRSTGREAARGLAPALPVRTDWEVQRPLRGVGRVDVVFPDAAISRGELGWVDAEITVGRDGRVRDVWVVESRPEGRFDAVTLDALRAMKFEPAQIDGKPQVVVFNLRWKFGFVGSDARDMVGIQDRLDKLSGEAAAGRVDSQYLLYRIAERFPELRKGVEWQDWGRKSVDAKFGPALFYEGYCLAMLRGGCLRSDRSGAMEMLRAVAIAGGERAQLALGRLALAEGSEAGIARARTWLEAANAASNPWAARYLAAALLASAEPGGRDGPRALALAEPLLAEPLMRGDATTWVLVAAAYAEVGRYPDAVKTMDEALARARRAGWDPGELDARRRAYSEGRLVGGAPLVLSALPVRAGIAKGEKGRVCEESPSVGTRMTRCEP